MNTMLDTLEAMFKAEPVTVIEAPRPVRRIVILPFARPAGAFDDSRCCSAAVRVDCVCRVSWKCPIHGARCIGSHD
jgi:hypothetical protein